MKSSFGEYQRLAKGNLGVSSLWLGPDHLLYVRGSGFLIPFSEEYRRYRYRDIQALVLAPTKGLLMGGVLLGLGFLVSVAVALAILSNRTPGSTGSIVALLLVPFPAALFFGFLLVRHFLLGACCVCELQTSLRRDRLRPLSRLGVARDCLEELERRVREAQVAEFGDELPAGSERGAASAVEGLLPSDTFAGLRVPDSARWAFGGGLVLGLAGLGGLLFGGVVWVVAVAAIAFLFATPLCIALASVSRLPCPDSVRWGLWTLGALLMLGAGNAFVFYGVEAIDDPGVTASVGATLEAFARLSLPALSDNWYFFGVFVLVALGSLLTSVPGLVLSQRYRRLAQTSEPLAPPSSEQPS